MKKLLLILAVMCLVVPVASAALLTQMGVGTSHSEEFGCGVCHDAHNNGQGLGTVPLWGALSSTGTLTGYDLGTANRTTLSGVQDPAGPSLMCMACHDGQSHQSTSSVGSKGDDAIVDTTAANGYIDTSVMHPVSFTYGAGVDDSVYFNADTTLSSVKLYDEKMECGSCHDIHTSVVDSQLRAADADTLCNECHVK